MWLMPLFHRVAEDLILFLLQPCLKTIQGKLVESVSLKITWFGYKIPLGYALKVGLADYFIQKQKLSHWNQILRKFSLKNFLTCLHYQKIKFINPLKCTTVALSNIKNIWSEEMIKLHTNSIIYHKYKTIMLVKVL